MVTGWATLNGSLGPMNNSRAVESYSLAGQAESEDSRGGDLPKTQQQGQGQNQTAAGAKATFLRGALIHPPSPRSSDTSDTLSVPCHVCHV